MALEWIHIRLQQNFRWINEIIFASLIQLQLAIPKTINYYEDRKMNKVQKKKKVSK